MTSTNYKRQRPDSDDDIDPSTIFRTQDTFPKFLIIESQNKEKPVASLSPFVIEKQIESLIGTPKSVKKTKKWNPSGRSIKKNSNGKSDEGNTVL